MESSFRVSEPKLVEGERRRTVSRWRRRYGEVRYLKPGVNVYVEKRRMDQYDRELGGWLVEAGAVSAARSVGATHLLIEAEDGTRWLLDMRTALRPGVATCAPSKTYRDAWGRTGLMCWHLPRELWRIAQPPEEQRDAEVARRMRVPGSRQRKSELTL